MWADIGGHDGVRDLEKLLMNLFQGIDSLLKFNVVRWKLSLWRYSIQSQLECSVLPKLVITVPCLLHCRAVPSRIAASELQRVRWKTCSRGQSGRQFIWMLRHGAIHVMFFPKA